MAQKPLVTAMDVIERLEANERERRWRGLCFFSGAFLCIGVWLLVDMHKTGGDEFVITIYANGAPSQAWKSLDAPVWNHKDHAWTFTDQETGKRVAVSGPVAFEQPGH